MTDDNRRIIAHVVSNGHSWEKHGDEFRDPTLGITTPLDHQRGTHTTPGEVTTFIRGVFQDPNTLTFHSPANPPRYPEPTEFLYSERLNTVVVLNPGSAEHFGTAFRLDGGIEQFRDLARNSPGSPAIRQGPNAVSGAINRFEQEIFNRPEALRTLQQRAATLNLEVVEPSTSSPSRAQQPDAPPAVTAAAAAAVATSVEALSDEARAVLEAENTLGFWADDNGRVVHYFDEQRMTVVTISPSGEHVRAFESAEEAMSYFGEKMDRAIQARGVTPDLIQGGHEAVAEAFRNTRGFWPRVGATVSDVAEFVGRTAKVLGPLGVIAATAEAEELSSRARMFADFDMLPEGSENFLIAYNTLLLTHIAQATVDPSMLGGEVAIQEGFDLLCATFEIPEHIKEQLEPVSLLEMIFGEGGHDVNAAYNTAFHNLYDALPLEISDDMPVEVQTLIQFKQMIEEAEAQLSTAFGLERNEIEARLENAENMYSEQYDELLENDQISEVIAYAFSNMEAPENDVNPAETSELSDSYEASTQHRNDAFQPS